MLTPKNYKERLIDNKIAEYMNSFGAVCVEGPKWCGKTWTSLNHAKSVSYIGSPVNNFQNRVMAELSPELVLQGELPRLIDEWQEVPAIWDAVRFEVDKEPGKGKYILTSSSTPKRKGILHSGAGRIGRIRMKTMSLYETGDSSGSISLMGLFEEKLQPVVTGDVKLEDLIYFVVRGGWPGNLGIDISLAKNLPVEYLKAVVEDDMYSTDGIKRDSRKVRSLLHSLGRNESTIVSNSTLRKDMAAYDETEIDSNTIAEYLDVFNRLFLLEEQPAFAPNLRSSRRVLKSPKRHFTDVSLAVAALEATPEMLLGDLHTFGFLFEALCEHDLCLYAEANGGQLFHYRDEKDNEIDAVIELPDGRWGAFEIKLGANQIDAAAKDLLKMKEIMVKEGTAPVVLCVVCGMTNMAYTREDGVLVVPITALRP
ncbi:MAG: ATP-binding protein [Lachnospiraceae bacterium]|nr:ATP-binding protein [Lachnospiraceae bacterium]MBP3576714.1 ATP-binding protein [Lachnospiraceae bacterium]